MLTQADLEELLVLLNGITTAMTILQQQFADTEDPLWSLTMRLNESESQVAALEERLAKLRRST